MVEEEEFRPLKGRRNRHYTEEYVDEWRTEDNEDEWKAGDRYAEEDEREGRDYYDPYLRDENGRPVLLKRGTTYRPGSRTLPNPSLKPILIPGSIFGGVLLLAGELLPAAMVAGSMLLVVIVVHLRR